MVEFQNVHFAFGASEVLRDATFAVAPGSFTVLTGRAGSGKTTVLRLCRGEVAATSGRVAILGDEVPRGDRAALAALRRRVGALERDPVFLDHLSVEENIALPLLAAGQSPEVRREDVDALLDWIGLADVAGRSPAQLSPEGRRRAALARALVADPDLLIADDPTAGLSGEAALLLLGCLTQINGMGRTILLATADTDVLDELAHSAPVDVLKLCGGLVEQVA